MQEKEEGSILRWVVKRWHQLKINKNGKKMREMGLVSKKYLNINLN